MITNKFDYAALSRKEINGTRHYCLPDGGAVPSVTTILDKTKPAKDKEALANWRKRVGEQKAKEVTVEAAGRGTRMHKYLEDYVTSDVLTPPGTNPYSIQSNSMAQEIITEGLANVTEYWGVEVRLYYAGLYAGTTDCLGIWKGAPAILDFKQANKPKKREWIDDYFLQLCAYALAHNETYGTNINTGVILMAVPPTTPVDIPMYQEFVIEGKEFDHYANKWAERVEEYYDKYG